MKEKGARECVTERGGNHFFRKKEIREGVLILMS